MQSGVAGSYLLVARGDSRLEERLSGVEFVIEVANGFSQFRFELIRVEPGRRRQLNVWEYRL